MASKPLHCLETCFLAVYSPAALGTVFSSRSSVGACGAEQPQRVVPLDLPRAVQLLCLHAPKASSGSFAL